MRDKLASFCNVVRGVSYSPYDLRDSYKNNRYYLLRSNNIKKGKLIFQDMQIVDENCVSSTQKLEKFDIAVCMSNGSKRLVGKSAQFKGASANFCVGAFCAGFRPNINSEPNYIFQLFQSQEYQKYIDITLAGSAINNLKGGDVLNFEFNFPPLPQQKKIAKILSTVDNVIEKTESAIAKYQAIKQGLMHDLFTRGIDVNTGKLRPKQQDAPELYKESVLGWIPKEWEVEELGKITSLIKDGTHGTHKDVLTGFPLLSAKDIYANKIHFPKNSRLISKEDYLSIYKSYSLEVNDILLTVVGTIGRSAIIQNLDIKFALQRSVAIIRVQNNCAQYVKHFMDYSLFQKNLIKTINASAQGGIYLGELAKQSIALPLDNEEQKIIKEKIDAIDKKIQTEQQALTKYQQLKAGLLQDLLTGKVEVKV